MWLNEIVVGVVESGPRTNCQGDRRGGDPHMVHGLGEVGV